MKHFVFNLKFRKEVSTEENGWVFRMKQLKRIGYFCLKSPVTKEVTQNKGSAVRYTKHSVFGIGYVDDHFTFRGIALFDLHIRCLVVLAVLAGVGYSSGNFFDGVFWALMFYLLISILSLSDDDRILCKAQTMSEM